MTPDQEGLFELGLTGEHALTDNSARRHAGDMLEAAVSRFFDVQGRTSQPQNGGGPRHRAHGRDGGLRRVLFRLQRRLVQLAVAAQ
jgi:hypothetical protein